MGVLGYMGEAWDPGKVFEDKESPGKVGGGVGGGGNASPLGISLSVLHPRVDLEPHPGRRPSLGRVSIQRQEAWTLDR